MLWKIAFVTNEYYPLLKPCTQIKTSANPLLRKKYIIKYQITMTNPLDNISDFALI